MIGRNIKRALERQGKTQRELAEDIGITEASMSRYIHGDRVPNATILVRLADALGVTVDQLISDEESPYGRLKLRVTKYTYSNMLDVMIRQINDSEDRKEFLEYARMKICKMLSRIKEGE